MKYRVIIRDILHWETVVEADNEEEARIEALETSNKDMELNCEYYDVDFIEPIEPIACHNCGTELPKLNEVGQTRCPECQALHQ